MYKLSQLSTQAKLADILNPILGRVNYSSPSIFENYEKAVGDLLSVSSSQFSSRMKLSEDESGWSLSLELPGYATKDVEVDIQDNTLFVKANNEKFGEVSRSLDLWSGIEFDKVSGKMENGILIVNLPKEVKKGKKIKLD